MRANSFAPSLQTRMKPGALGARQERRPSARGVMRTRRACRRRRWQRGWLVLATVLVAPTTGFDFDGRARGHDGVSGARLSSRSGIDFGKSRRQRDDAALPNEGQLLASEIQTLRRVSVTKSPSPSPSQWPQNVGRPRVSPERRLHDG